MATRVTDGKVYTPTELALLAASKLYEYQDIARQFGAKRYGGRVVWDPCCGEGALLQACKRIDSQADCCGMDIDANACDIASVCGLQCAAGDLFEHEREPGSGGQLIVCNPPYVGRSNIRDVVGEDRFKWLKATYKAERSGSCDLAGYVLRHILQAWRPVISTWLVTNTIAQGATRRIGLCWALANGYQIVSALKDIPWPGDAAVTIHVITIVDTEQLGGWIPKQRCEYVPRYQLMAAPKG